MLNKQIGLKLDISEITVKAHRGKVMQKMKADSVADLVKTAVRLGLAPAKNPWLLMSVIRTPAISPKSSAGKLV